MIFRTIHDKDNPYFQLNRMAVNDERLSFKAIGIHTYLMSKPDGWEANTSDLVARHPDGMASVRSGIDELTEFGYIKRVRVIDSKGRVTGWTMNVYEVPQDAASPECENRIVDIPECENHTANYPECDYPQVENPQVENRTLVINEYKENKYIAADAAPHTDSSSDSETQIETLSVVVEKEKPVRKTSKRKAHAAPTTDDEAPKLPTEHQQMFEKICQIVGWDWKTLGEKEKGQVAQTLGILKKAEYTLDELNRFGKEVWVKDWRWAKHRQYPTLSLLRSEIGKLRQTEQQKEEMRTPTEGVSWRKVFEEQKAKFAEYEW